MNQELPPRTGRFTVLRQIGRGGMGRVYEAFDNERNMRVALKQLPTVDPGSVYSFKQEFRSLAEISHPNLVPLYELIFEHDQWFFTMELLDDPVNFFPRLPSRARIVTSAKPGVPTIAQEASLNSSEATLFGEQVSPVSASQPDHSGLHPEVDAVTLESDFARVRDVFRQLAEGVHYLHQAGKLHRDLKPGNVIVRSRGRVVVLDFGLVIEVVTNTTKLGKVRAGGKISSLSTSSENAASVSGTAGYMSPEQALADRLEPASDWYSFGVMLFQALTGRLPFSGSASKVLNSKTTETAPSPSEFRQGIPEDLESLCVALLQRDPTLRPRGTEILTSLTENGSGTPESSSASATSELPFIGREKEMATLRSAFTHTRSGQGVVCHVQGPSGTGKSALIHRFIDELDEESSAIVLSGRCYEQESVPYKGIDGVIDALTRYLLRQPESVFAGLLPPSIGALPTVFPVLNRVNAVVREAKTFSAGNNPKELRRTAFKALRELFVRLARRHGLVIYIDDLQWGDLDSASLLGELLQPPDPPQMLLLVSYRSEYSQTSPCLRRLAEWEVKDVATRLRPRISVESFNPAETIELAVSLLGGDRPENRAKAEWVVRESGGSAIFIYELVRHIQAGMDQSLVAGIALDQVLWNRVTRLEGDNRKLVEIVAVAGKPVTLRNVQRAGNFASLPPSLVAGLRADHFVRTSGPGLDDDIEIFHDRVRESVIANLDAETLKFHHSCLAAAMAEASDADPETIAFHLEGSGQWNKAGQFYARAADQAKQILAFDRAEDFYQNALRLLESPMERSLIQERLIHFYTDMARFHDAYGVAREAVKQFGISLPARFRPPLLVASFIRSKLLLKGRKPADLLALRRMTDKGLEAGVRLINATAKAAYQIRPELCVAISTQAVNLCLKHGNTPDCAISYMVYGAIFQGGVLGNHPVGHDFGRLALELVEKYQNHKQRAEVNFVVGYFGTSWLKPATDAESLWENAYRSGIETGDLFHTGCACAATIMSHYMRGVPTAAIVEKASSYRDFLKQHHLQEPLGVVTAVEQAIANLQGKTTTPETFSGPGFDEDHFRAELQAFGSRHFAHFYYILKMQSLLLWGHLERAARVAATSERYLKESPGMLHSTEHQFYLSLILAEQAAVRSGVNRLIKRRAFEGVRRKFEKWSSRCPQNFESRSHVLSGVSHTLKGRGAPARLAFADARRAAQRSGDLPLEAMSWWLEAKHLAALKEMDHARQCLNSAAESWHRWGAHAYAEQLPQVLGMVK